MRRLVPVLALAALLLLPLPLGAQPGAAGAGQAAARGGTGVGAVARPASVTPLVAVRGAEFTPLYTLDGGPVTVASFRMDAFPVTRRQFADFVAADPRWRRDLVAPLFADRGYLADWQDHLTPGGNPDAPVTRVSWFAARAYCGSLGRRLPSIDEWELAARADETRFDAGADSAFQRRILELYTTRPKTPPAVGSGFRNRYGLHDMHGLVWEWVADFNSVASSADSRTGDNQDTQLYCAAGADGATDRGDYAAFLRYAFRASLKGSAATGALGFRCAADM